eukprot:1140675-Pelagomonas_calceolata.AAC.1
MEGSGCPKFPRGEQESSDIHHWCGKPLNQTARTPFCITSYLSKDLDTGVMRNVSRFRLRAHCLKVESCKWWVVQLYVDLTELRTQFQLLFSSVPPSSASRLKNFMNQADVLGLAKFAHALLQLNCSRRQ